MKIHSFAKVIVLILGLLLLFGISGCNEKRIGGSMSTSDERNLGARYASELDKQLKYVDDPKLNSRIIQISMPIFVQANKDRNDVAFRVRIVDDKEVNAFSIPGGYIYIYKGLLDKLGNDDDAIACVIGHESAHVVNRHVVKAIADSQSKGLLLGITAILTKSSDVAQYGDLVLDLEQLHFSRGDEYQADRYGERYAFNAGYDPAGMIRTFDILDKVEKDAGGRLPTYAVDHPINRNRSLRAMEQWRELRANNGRYISGDYNPKGDEIAAKSNGIDYNALVLSTKTTGPVAKQDKIDEKKQ